MGRVSQKARALAAARLIWRVAALPPLRLFILLLAIGSVGASLVGCGSGGNGEKLGERVIPLGQPVPKGGGRYATGVAYKVDGVWYQPREDAAYDRVGTASWYGELFHGRRTANGEIYDMERLSAASTTLPMPVYARVTNLENRRSIIVRVNDRGPYRSSRIMDVSRRSAEVLGFRHKGTARVRVQYLARAPLNGDDSYERRYLASQSWAQVASRGGARDHDAVGSIAAGVKRPAKRAYQAETVAATAAGANFRLPPRRRFAGRRAPVPSGVAARWRRGRRIPHSGRLLQERGQCRESPIAAWRHRPGRGRSDAGRW